MNLGACTTEFDFGYFVSVFIALVVGLTLGWIAFSPKGLHSEEIRQAFRDWRDQ